MLGEKSKAMAEKEGAKAMDEEKAVVALMSPPRAKASNHVCAADR
jgi:hypothetical protein